MQCYVFNVFFYIMKVNEAEFCIQLIFRKVADVRREKELAERRKNEPQLDQAQDHLVRKIFSR